MQNSFAAALEEKRLDCEALFCQELEQDKIKWKQSSDQMILDLM